MEEYRKLVETGRKQLHREMASIMLDVKLGEQTGKLTWKQVASEAKVSIEAEVKRQKEDLEAELREKLAQLELEAEAELLPTVTTWLFW